MTVLVSFEVSASFIKRLNSLGFVVVEYFTVGDLVQILYEDSIGNFSHSLNKIENSYNIIMRDDFENMFEFSDREVSRGSVVDTKVSCFKSQVGSRRPFNAPVPGRCY